MRGDGPLEGVRVLDLTALLPGPMCTLVLADMGAEVIRVERVGAGTMATGEKAPAGRDHAHAMIHRNKKSVCVDMKSADGLEVFRRLAESADVVVEGNRPGVAKRLGVDYETLAARNPRLVYCSITGFGQDGPYSHLPGHDPNYLAISGVGSLMGTIDGTFLPPAWPQSDFAVGGLQSVIGILCALMAREQTGRGQFVDLAMTDGMLFFVAARYGPAYFTGGAAAVPKRGHRLSEVYECADGKFVNCSAVEPHFWVRLCRALGLEEHIVDHPVMFPFAEPTERRAEVVAALSRQFLTRTRDEWVKILWDADTCAVPVLDIGEALEDVHFRHRGMIQEVDDPTYGPVRMGGIPIHLSETPGTIRSLPAAPGEHTDEVLLAAGYSATEIGALRASASVA